MSGPSAAGPLAGRAARSLRIAVPGASLHAWFVAPDAPPPWPTVVAAHGWGAVKEMNLDYLAAALADAGLAALVFDHRGVGASDGERGDLDPEQQIADYGSVLTAAAALDGVDPARLGIWGTSYSGGHVLCVGARDRRVRAVVSQVPTISGSANTRLRYSEAERADMAREVAAGGARMVPAIPRAPFAVDAVPAPDPVAPDALPPSPTDRYDNETARFYTDLGAARRATWSNAVTLRARDRYARYEPGRSMAAVAPTPLLVIMAEDDTITPSDQIRAAFAETDASAQLLAIPGGHYDVYASGRERVNARAAAFLAESLG